MTEMENMVQLRRRKRGGVKHRKQAQQGMVTGTKKQGAMRTKEANNSTKEQAPAMMDLASIPWDYSRNPNQGRNEGGRRILEEIELAF